MTRRILEKQTCLKANQILVYLVGVIRAMTAVDSLGSRKLAPETVPSRDCEEWHLLLVVGDDRYASATGMYGGGVWEVTAPVTASNW